jgi:uncharacterized membrane protein YccF (DUF307 family)
LRLIGNIVWLILGGLPLAIVWLLAGVLWGITIVGIPIARQCLKFAGLQLAPFGKEVVEADSTGLGLLANIVWLLLGGLELALLNLIEAVVLGITIIGIPLAKQNIKLAKLALAPFGKRIVDSRQARR